MEICWIKRSRVTAPLLEVTMAFGMFSAQVSPIAIDFGSSSIKLLQIGAGDRPPLVAAAEIAIPDAIRGDADRLSSYYAEALPKFLRDGKFKGKRAVMAVPSSQTLLQHMQIGEGDADRDQAVKNQLMTQMGVAPDGVVVRSMEVCPVHRNGQSQKEMICFAISRETVMQYVELLTKSKLEVVGVHTDTLAMIRSFDHVARRGEDASVTTLYIDMGYGGTRVAITHGQQLMFARYIQIGGKHFDQLIANAVKCDIASARAHRLSLPGGLTRGPSAGEMEPIAVLNAAVAKAGGATATAVKSSASAQGRTITVTVTVDRRVGIVPPELNYPVKPGDGHRKAVNVDISEPLDTITDEVSMCLRYHQGLFGDRKIDRAIFVGGEARQGWLCQHVVKVLRVSAQMGDPLARLDMSRPPYTPGLNLGQPQPGWAVACGLCSAPTDL